MLGWRWLAARISGAVIPWSASASWSSWCCGHSRATRSPPSLGTESARPDPAPELAVSGALLRHRQAWPGAVPWTWLGGVLHGDLGVSLTSGKPVSTPAAGARCR